MYAILLNLNSYIYIFPVTFYPTKENVQIFLEMAFLQIFAALLPVLPALWLGVVGFTALSTFFLKM